MEANPNAKKVKSSVRYMKARHFIVDNAHLSIKELKRELASEVGLEDSSAIISHVGHVLIHLKERGLL